MTTIFPRSGRRCAPGSLSRSLLITVLLWAVIVGSVVVLNRHYFLHAENYPTGDQAANSLDVLRCKKFEDYLGAYSRWGFHHPGPILFYCFALGETVFWKWFGLGGSPYTSQTLTTLLLTVFFFVVGVGIASRWVRSRYFVPLAVLLAGLHYLAVHLQMCVVSVWPPYITPMPYFCLLIAAASVAAGQGDDLPWMVLAGCVLIHIHVANPLFVLPLFALAYAGLLWSGRRRKAMRSVEEATAAGLIQGPGWPWRLHPVAHRVSLGMVVVFVLPILIDLSLGSKGNFPLILKHLRTHQGERYPYIDAVYYVLRFGVYRPSVNGDVEVRRGTTPALIQEFIARHPQMAMLWAVALLLPVLVLAFRLVARAAARQAAARAPGSTAAAVAPSVDWVAAARWRFLGRLVLCWVVCLPLALYWGHIQDGQLLYYNAWYIYSLYGVLTVIAAVALSDGLEGFGSLVPRLRQPLRFAVPLLCVVATLVTFWKPGHPERAHAYDGNSDAARAQVRTVREQVAAHPETHRTKFLIIPDEAALGAAPGIGIELKRLGYSFRVMPKWKVMLGEENGLSDNWLEGRTPPGEVPPMEAWWLTKLPPKPGAPPAPCPLLDGYVLRVGYSEIDPGAGAAIRFAGPGRNSDLFALAGFLEPAPESKDTWTVDHVGRMDFTSKPVPADSEVELALDFFPPLINTAHPTQRLEARYNGTALGTIAVGTATPPDSLRFRVPAALWNEAPHGVLILGFPDAISPAEMNGQRYGDVRILGFVARKITFQVVPPPTAPSAGAP